MTTQPITKTTTRKSTAIRYTDAQKKSIIERVKSLTKKGEALHAAVKKAGITYSSYRSWTGAPRTTRAKQTLESIMIPMGNDSPLVILVGKPQDVNSALQQLTSVMKG